MATIEKIYNKNNSTKFENKAKKVQVTFQELSDIHKLKILKDPCIQTALEEDRINGICESWSERKEFILTERPLLIGILEDDNNKEYLLIDGQHKFNAAIRLCDKKDINLHLDCVFIKIHTEDELDNLFEIVNKDSYKNQKKNKH